MFFAAARATWCVIHHKLKIDVLDRVVRDDVFDGETTALTDPQQASGV
jgi:hypothetical protein